MMCCKIQPYTVINYGTAFDWMKECSDLITVPYKHASIREEDS
jgi:hypothetical protein